MKIIYLIIISVFFLGCTSNKFQLSTENSSVLDLPIESKGSYVIENNKMYINMGYTKKSILTLITTAHEDVFNIYMIVDINEDKVNLKSAEAYFRSMGLYRFEDGKLKIAKLNIQKSTSGEYYITSIMKGKSPNRGSFSANINNINLKKISSHKAFIEKLNPVDRNGFLVKKFRVFINP